LANVPAPAVTTSGPRFCQLAGDRTVVPHKVAPAAPGAVNPNRNPPFGSRMTELELMFGVSTMLKTPLLPNRDELVELLMRIE
jgi:hypothetical protein